MKTFILFAALEIRIKLLVRLQKLNASNEAQSLYFNKEKKKKNFYSM